MKICNPEPSFVLPTFPRQLIRFLLKCFLLFETRGRNLQTTRNIGYNLSDLSPRTEETRQKGVQAWSFVLLTEPRLPVQVLNTLQHGTQHCILHHVKASPWGQTIVLLNNEKQFKLLCKQEWLSVQRLVGKKREWRKRRGTVWLHISVRRHAHQR